ncbi:lysosomal alpha-mannosidase [Nesidiocoris tenuis]|uniref:Alpha-mannosidase n=1 Tax=Nesidiocoris tenuis TaxID=355587 RepID=A0ABN7A631_9HEMI|nr:lysosomal alpha-mannosidase [Nesidiocoris tenuis]
MRVIFLTTFIVVTILVSASRCSPPNRIESPTPTPRPSCGYETCPKPKAGYINLHLVPHTHDDVGWLKTLDQYYYGSKNHIQDAGVQYILDSVIQELSHDRKKRFIYVETAFFWKWWQEQDDAMRHLVKKLVNRGQLEFIGGAWSMNDEAATHYQSIVDQFTWGFKRLSDNFGECGRPRVGWQIDPFGHSRENAAIMARLGFDGLFLGRIDWEDKSYRLKNKTMEMIWHTSENDDSDDSELFTGVMYNTYSAPPGFCFDINCQDEPIIDNPKSPMYNANRRVSTFLQMMVKYSKAYRTQNVIVTMGDDFMYQSAHTNFKNMDKLIQHINAIQGEGLPFNAFYSTPSCYLKAVHDSGIALPSKRDDFFPYSSDPNSFWTGYFTSRPTIKRFERLGNNYLQVCKQLYSLGGLTRMDRPDLVAMREAMGVMQHHDAVTGTEKQHVANDYARILSTAIEDCNDITGKALRKLMGAEQKISMSSCLLMNISSCPFTEENEDGFVVTVYNPLSRVVSPLLRLPVPSDSGRYSVKCPEGKEHQTQLVPIPPETLQIPGRASRHLGELSFIAGHVPPLGFKSFFVSKQTNAAEKSKMTTPKGPSSIGYDGRFINLDEDGLVTSITIDGRTENFEIDLGYYIGAVGNNEVFENRSSGAYIFRPKGSLNVFENKPQVTIIRGDVSSEVRYTFNDWVSSILRIHKGAEPFNIEHEWTVGPIPIDEKGFGKEVVIRYHVKDLHNNGEFLTDSNGREMLKRTLNYRPTWNVVLEEKIAGNYYPVTTRIAIEENTNIWSIVTDRAQGGASLEDGTMELMVHRRLTHDDAFGVGEALNETAYGVGLVARGSHFIVPGSHGNARKVVQNKVLEPWVFLTPTGGADFDDWRGRYKMIGNGLKKPLDERIQILTLEPWTASSHLLRLEHILEKNDDLARRNELVSVDIQDLFADWEVVQVTEMMLGANAAKSEVTRLKWHEQGKMKEAQEAAEYQTTPQPPTHIAKLKPMDIKTYIVELRPKEHY